MPRFFKSPLNQKEITLIFACLILQILFAVPFIFFPTIGTDIDGYRSWLRSLVTDGLEHAYWGSTTIALIDYPPLIPYIYYCIGKLIFWISPELYQLDTVINLLIKLPAIFCNFLISVILIKECKQQGFQLSNTSLLIAGFNAAAIFNTLYWGQSDSIVCLLLLCSLLELKYKKLTPSYVYFTLACFAKPLAWPLSLLILLASIQQHQIKEIIRSFFIALFTSPLVLLPFLADGNGIKILNEIFTSQIDAMPLISVNAHNLWWLIATYRIEWTHSYDLIAGTVSYRTIAITLFLAAYFSILVRANQNIREAQFDILKTASLIALAFFSLSPHMHENHLIYFFPLAFIPMINGSTGGKGHRYYILLIACSTLNMVLGDVYILKILKTLLLKIINPIIILLGKNPENYLEFTALIIPIITKINALIITMIFLQLFWHHQYGKYLSKLIGINITILLSVIACVRFFI